MTTKKPTKKKLARPSPLPEVPSQCDYRPWWAGKRRRSHPPTAFDLYASAALTGFLVRESAETTLSELVEGALHLATLMEAAREEQGK